MEMTDVMAKTQWIMDPAHTEIGFKVKHLVFSTMRGTFKQFDAGIFTNGTDFSSAEIKVSIQADSVHTGADKRDQHLRSADFFDTEHFKDITFSSSMIEPANDEKQYALSGDLAIKGITRKIVLQVELNNLIKDPWGMERALFTISGVINRKDWGLNYNAALETGGVLISEEVSIQCEVQLIKQEK